MDKLKIMDKSNGQIGNNGQIMDKNDLKWILNGLNGNHTLVWSNEWEMDIFNLTVTNYE